MKPIYFFIPLLLAQGAVAQSKLPVIKATSKSMAINDGGYLDKNAWTLSPKARPDVYTADRTRKTKWVTFYTDIDSIKVKVKPGTKFYCTVKRERLLLYPNCERYFAGKYAKKRCDQ